MAEEQIRVDVVANDEASKVVGDVADAVEDLERHDTATVTVSADDREVLDDLDEIRRQVGLVDAESATIDVNADTSAAERAMRGLDDKHHGKAIGESFVRDITGSMGDGASQLGGVFADSVAGIETTFETLGSNIGGKMGTTISGIGTSFATALGVGGVIFVALDTFYSWWKKRNDDQKKAVEETWKALKDAAGDTAAVLEKDVVGALEKLNDKQREALKGAGINMQDLITLIEGGHIPAVDDLKASYDEFEKAQADAHAAGRTNQNEKVAAANTTMANLRDEHDAYRTLKDLIDDQGGAIQGAIDKYNDLAAIMGKPLIPTLDVSAIERQMRDLTTKALNLGGLFHFNVTPTAVATASALDTRRQGSRSVSSA